MLFCLSQSKDITVLTSVLSFELTVYMAATVVYTDGSCSPNPGKGGWAWVAYVDISTNLEPSKDGVALEYSDYGGKLHTTNNAMEATALLRFLQDAPTGKEYLIHIDSIYVLRWVCDTKQLPKGAPYLSKSVPNSAPNAKTFQLIHREHERHTAAGTTFLYFHVKGHSGDRGNSRADELANKGRFELG